MGGKDRGGRGRRRGGLIHGRGEQDVVREASAHSAPTGGRRKTIKGDFPEKLPGVFRIFTIRSFSNKNSETNLVFRAFLQTENLAKMRFGILKEFPISPYFTFPKLSKFWIFEFWFFNKWFL